MSIREKARYTLPLDRQPVVPLSDALELEGRVQQLAAEVVRLRTALNGIAWPPHYGTEGQDPRHIAIKALNIAEITKISELVEMDSLAEIERLKQERDSALAMLREAREYIGSSPMALFADHAKLRVAILARIDEATKGT